LEQTGVLHDNGIVMQANMNEWMNSTWWMLISLENAEIFHNKFKKPFVTVLLQL
jgi:hypothetical protein